MEPTAKSCSGASVPVARGAGSVPGSATVMRAGATPQEACERAIARIIEKNPKPETYQVGMLAMDFAGRTGAYAVQRGFTYALQDELRPAPSMFT